MSEASKDVKDAKTPSVPLPPPAAGESAAYTSGGTDGAPTRNKSLFSIAGLKRSASNAIQSAEGQATSRFLKASGKTIVGLHPVWLMGEAITGRKVGSQFRRGKDELLVAAEELRGILGVSAQDILVVVDSKLKTQKEQSTKTAEVLRSAGQDAIVVVTTSLLGSKAQFEKNAPGLKHTVLKNSKDVVIILDKAIKNPIVVTGVTKYAKSHGVPRPEAIMTLAVLGVGKLVKILEEAEGEAKKELEKFEAEAREAARHIESDVNYGDVVVVDAEDFEKASPKDQVKDAKHVAHDNAAPAASTSASTSAAPRDVKANEPAVPGALPAKDGKDKPKKDDGGCIIM